MKRIPTTITLLLCLLSFAGNMQAQSLSEQYWQLLSAAHAAYDEAVGYRIGVIGHRQDEAEQRAAQQDDRDGRIDGPVGQADDMDMAYAGLGAEFSPAENADDGHDKEVAVHENLRPGAAAEGYEQGAAGGEQVEVPHQAMLEYLHDHIYYTGRERKYLDPVRVRTYPGEYAFHAANLTILTEFEYIWRINDR